MSNSVTVQSQSNLLANVAVEADNILATTKSHEKLLKFKKGKYEVMDDEVRIGTEFIAHANQLMFCWIKFIGNEVVDRKMGRAAEGYNPPERNELGDTDQAQWEVRDGELKDPWTFQHLLPFENPETGEVYVFTTSSIGGQIATEALAREWAKRIRRTGSRAMPMIRLGVTQMRTKKYGDVARPCFEVVGWEDDGPAVNTGAMRTVNVSDIPDVPDLDPPPHDGEDLPF